MCVIEVLSAEPQGELSALLTSKAVSGSCWRAWSPMRVYKLLDESCGGIEGNGDRRGEEGEGQHDSYSSTWVEVLTHKLDAFTWSSSNMLGMDPNFLCHKLVVKHSTKLVTQKRNNKVDIYRPCQGNPIPNLVG